MNEAIDAAALSSCERLAVAFAYLVDSGQAERVVELFAPDGRFERRGEVLRGQAEIRAAQQRRPANVTTRHLCSPPHVRLLTPDQAVGVTYFQLYRHAWPDGQPAGIAPLGEPEVLGEYHDEFRLTPAGWRIQSRTARAIFRRPD